MKLKIMHNQRGDTIMEVLICVAMLGFMLGAAFSLTNKNQQSARASQERSEATKIAEKQIEYLRAHYAKHATGPFDPPLTDNFCFKEDASIPDKGYKYVENVGLASPSPVIVSGAANEDKDSNYVADCKLSPNGYNYRISAWKAGTANATTLGAKAGAFVVTVRWDSVKGNGQEEVKMFYTIDQLSAGFYTSGIPVTPPSPPPPPSNFCTNIPGPSLPPGMTQDPATGFCKYTPYTWYGTWNTGFFGFMSFQFPGLTPNLTCSPVDAGRKTCLNGYTFWLLSTVINWSSPIKITYDLKTNLYNYSPVDYTFSNVATPLGSSTIPAGPAILNMYWTNDENNGLSPPPGYKPQVRIRINDSGGGSYNPCAPADYCQLPSYPNNSLSNLILAPIDIVVPENATTLTVEWLNDAWSPGVYDANVSFPDLRIERN
ncbi:hypothetical protein A3F37_04055 [Candidatus Saccharibacteria bacterium RIFCSPHIGHO2_12_FULL_41_12]|nr:MAG: hypothetical protein A3F37_04055 [Candidatus Saccharibacteria bacterium RIFCSPHIGHO2_12_FULL_41_12]